MQTKSAETAQLEMDKLKELYEGQLEELRKSLVTSQESNIKVCALYIHKMVSM